MRRSSVWSATSRLSSRPSRWREELAVERDCQQKAEQERDGAVAALQKAEERMPEMLVTQDARKASPGTAEAHAWSADGQETGEVHAGGRGHFRRR